MCGWKYVSTLTLLRKVDLSTSSVICGMQSVLLFRDTVSHANYSYLVFDITILNLIHIYVYTLGKYVYFIVILSKLSEIFFPNFIFHFHKKF